MSVMEREFYRSARGPAPGDIDRWRVVFDSNAGILTVRHEWQSERHSGVDDFGVAEFLAEQGTAQTALLRLLFGEVMAEAEGPEDQRSANA